MSLIEDLPIDFDALVDVEKGVLDRRIFSDEEIFELEMKNIFGRAWLFLCHESQIPKRGDFFEAPMGRDNVLVVRQRDGSIKALVNSCTHRGNAVCRADEGNVKNFMCTYHGWTFDLAGELVGVPGMTDFYNDELDRSKFPLKKVAQLESYKGFVFATFDPEAPPLEEYLGLTGRISLSLVAERGDMEIVPGIQKFTLDCNWKLAVDNSFDFYHAQITHISAQAVGMLPAAPDQLDSGGAMTSEGKALGVQRLQTDMETLVLLSEYGHAVSGPNFTSFSATVPPEILSLYEWRDKPAAVEALGPFGREIAGHPHLFPTMWITVDCQISLRVPRGPRTTEIWWFSLRDKNAPEEEKKAQLARQIHMFGPAGFLEQEDGENWAQSTINAYGTHGKNIPQQLKMGIGRGKIVKEHGLARIEAPVNEHAQLWTYLAWKEWLKNSSWERLRERTTPGEYL